MSNNYDGRRTEPPYATHDDEIERLQAKVEVLRGLLRSLDTQIARGKLAQAREDIAAALSSE